MLPLMLSRAVWRRRLTGFCCNRGSVKHLEDSFKGYKDLRLYYQGWLPADVPRAVLLVVHGLAEHSGRYMNLVNHFVPRGYAVYALDHRGHGKSEGWRCYVEQFEHYVRDLEAFVSIVKEIQPGHQVYMFGHSMGSTISAAYVLLNQAEIDGLIVTGATLKPGNSVTPLQILMARVISAVLPRMGIATLDAVSISQDRDVVQAYINDPLVYRGKVSARLGSELLKVMKQIRQRLSQIQLPVLILHGNEDRLSDPQSSQLMYDNVSSIDKTLLFYKGYHHEIHNEPGRNRVLADIENWLEVRT